MEHGSIHLGPAESCTVGLWYFWNFSWIMSQSQKCTASATRSEWSRQIDHSQAQRRYGRRYIVAW